MQGITTKTTWLTGLSCALLATGAQAAMVDLRGAGGAGGGYGNALTFTALDGINVTVRAFAETGAESPANSGYHLFQSAEAFSWPTGIGVCNVSEGVAGGGCNNNEHEIDTVGFDDLVAFVFDRVVNFEFLTVDPFDGSGSDPNDRDIIYWVGNAASLPNLGTQTFFTLASMAGFGSEVQSAASSSYAPHTHALTGAGNILLLAGNYHDLRCKSQNVSQDSECEAYKLANLTVTAAAVVPLPAAGVLLASGLLGLGVLRRRIAGRG